MKRSSQLLLQMLLSIFITAGASGQLYTTDYARPVLMGARASAMGDAYAAATFDASSLYWNPSTLMFDENSSFLFDHFYAIDAGINNDIFAIAIPNIGQGTLGLGATMSHIGMLGFESGAGYHAVVYGFDAGYAAEVSSGFSLGARFHGQFGSDGATLTSNFWTVGAAYHPSSDITYGIVYGGIGEDLYLADSTTLVSQSMPRRLELAIAMKYPSVAGRRILEISISNEKIFGETGLYYKGGLEVLPFQFLAVRYGYILSPTTGAPRYGFGIITELFRLDYAIAPAVRDLQFQQLTLSVVTM